MANNIFLFLTTMKTLLDTCNLSTNSAQRFMGSHQYMPAGVVGLGFVHAQTPLAAAMLLDGHCGMEDSEPQCCGVLTIQKK